MRKISVIIFCHNAASYIDRCVASITVQTTGVDDLELICIDDASVDDTWGHLQRWEQLFPENVLLIRLEIEGGQGAARNIGLQYASGDWIAFVGAKDFLEPDHFEQLYGAAVRYACDVVSCGWVEDPSSGLSFLDKEKRAGGKDRYFLADTLEKKKEQLVGRSLGDAVWGKLIRKSLIAEHQLFFPEGVAYEERYWMPLLHVYAASTYTLGETLYHHAPEVDRAVTLEEKERYLDQITVQMMKWAEYAKRGLLQGYREGLEHDLLQDAVDIVKGLILSFAQPSFSYFQLEKEMIGQLIPDYKNEPYFHGFTGVSSLLLEALYLPMDKEGFQKLAEVIKKDRTLSAGGHMPEEEQQRPDKSLRIVLFYSETESFNFFTDRLAEGLQKRGHEVFICDLEDTSAETEHSYKHLNRFLARKVDVVICFDGIGTREEQFIQQWDKHQAVVLDILMDPPFRFHPTLEKHPKDYMLFCCDQEHVGYVKKYFAKEVPNVAFMPHVGTVIEEDGPIVPYKERKYDILFSASYYPPQSQLAKGRELFPDRPDMWSFYQQMFENLVKDSCLTIEQAVLDTIQQLGLSVSDGMLKMLLNRSLYVDWAIRMYQRERVVTALAGAGLEIYLLGPGWEEHPAAGCPNVHHLDGRVPYRQTLTLMADAKINLNVMPWFKAGTHDRIFNTLLQHSLPLTDPSSWITDHFTDGVDIALYDLEHLELLPDVARQLLTEPQRAEGIIQRGYEKVRRGFTWSEHTDWLLEAADRMRRKRGQKM